MCGRACVQLGPATVQDVLQRHGAQAYLAGHLHGIFGPRLHRLHPGPGGGAPRSSHQRRTGASKGQVGLRWVP